MVTRLTTSIRVGRSGTTSRFRPYIPEETQKVKQTFLEISDSTPEELFALQVKQAFDTLSYLYDGVIVNTFEGGVTHT